MPVSYSATTKDNRLKAVVDVIDSKVFVPGSGAGAAGALVIGTSALAGSTGVLATIPLPNPSATVSGGVLTLAGVPLFAAATATGTAALAEIRNNAGDVVVGGLTVGVSAADIIITSVSISVGQTIQVNSGTITHA